MERPSSHLIYPNIYIISQNETQITNLPNWWGILSCQASSNTAPHLHQRTPQQAFTKPCKWAYLSAMSAWKGCSWTPPPDAIVTTRMIHPFFMGGTPTWRNLHRFAMLHILEWVQLTSPQKIVPLPNPSTCDIFVRCFQPFFLNTNVPKTKHPWLWLSHWSC